MNFARSGTLWPLAGIALLLAFNAACDARRGGAGAIFAPGSFLHLALRDGVLSGALVDVLGRSAKTIILACGMALVVATRGVDLSVGSTMAVAGAAAAVALNAGAGAAAAAGLALAAGAACGAWNAVLVAGARLTPFVATLVWMIAGRGVAQWITGGQIETFRDPLLDALGGGRLPWLPLPPSFLLAMALLGATALAVRGSAAGMLLEAIGGNPEAARLAGVRVLATTAGAYVACGATAGLAGLLAAAEIHGADPFHAGRNMELAAIFAVVVGGTSLSGGRFSLAGAAAGAVLLQALTTTLYARDVAADVAPLPQALAILAVCLLSSPRARHWWARRGTAP